MTNRRFLLLVMVAMLLALAAAACGVKAGDRQPARPTPTKVFHRTPIGVLEPTRINLQLLEGKCSAEPSEITLKQANRIRLAIQLPTELKMGPGGSPVETGERAEVTFQIPGLQIQNVGGAMPAGSTSIDLTLTSGPRTNYDFNVANTGTFDMLCNGEKVGTVTVE